MPVSLTVNKLSDVGPVAVVQQVDELRQLMELRSALTALKGPLGNVPAFRRKLQKLLGDDEARKKLMTELGMDKTDSDS